MRTTWAFAFTVVAALEAQNLLVLQESLRLARLFLDEMHQDMYPYPDGSLMSELTTTPPALNIRTEPAAAEPQSPVKLALRFNRQILNEAMARNEWQCSWDFGNGSPPETGWEVYHSFSSAGPSDLQVTLTDVTTGNAILPNAFKQTITVGLAEAQAPSGWWQELSRLPGLVGPARLTAETCLEASRLWIVLALAVFGLMASARQQAQSLSFLEAVGAVIALGFGADTLKNLVTQRAAAAPEARS